MCTAIGLATLIFLIIIWCYISYRVFRWIDSLEDNPTNIHWIPATLLGIMMTACFVAVILGLIWGGYAIYTAAPTVGCWIINHIPHH